MINRFTCTGFLYQRGQWQMTGLYGADRHAFGFGRFTLTERIQVGRHHHRCDPADVISETVNVTGIRPGRQPLTCRPEPAPVIRGRAQARL